MDDLPPAEAKSVGAGVRYLPFGIPGLDGQVRGIPTGSAVMLAGAPDAGSDAFVYTSLASLMLAKHNPRLYHGRVGDVRESIPERVSYVSLTHDRDHIYSELDAVLDTGQFEALTEHLTVADFSQQFLDAAPVPDALYAERRDDVAVAAEGDATIDGVLDAVSEHIAEVGEDAIVVIDDLADLVRAKHFGLSQDRILGFLLGIREAVVEWDGLAYVSYQRRAADVRSDLDVHGLFHGSVYFYSNDKGFDTYRTMRVGSFGGALDTERQVVFETSVGPTGFRAKATKKIAPSNW